MHSADTHIISSTVPYRNAPITALKGTYNLIAYGTVAILNILLLGYAAYLAR